MKNLQIEQLQTAVIQATSIDKLARQIIVKQVINTGEIEKTNRHSGLHSFPTTL